MKRARISPPPGNREEFSSLGPLLMIIDGLLVLGSGLFCLWVLATFTHRSNIVSDGRYMLLVTLAALVFPLLMQVLGAYRYGSALSLRRALMRNVASWMAVFSAVLVLLVAFKLAAQFSRAWLGAWGLTTMAVLLGMQIFYGLYLQRRRASGTGIQRVAIVGDGDQASRLISELKNDDSHVFVPVCYFGNLQGLSGIPNYGSLEDAPNALRGDLARTVDEVWVLQSGVSSTITERLYYSADLHLFDVRFVPDLRGFDVSERQIEKLGGHILIGLSTRPQRGIEGVLKLAIDWFGALIGGILLLPFFGLVAAAIRIETPGPIFFRQQRHGLNGRVFTIFKFRTMSSEHLHMPGQPLRQVERQDSRVTRVGRLLRSWSIDEFPQLINVLRGEMSLIGPRPHEVSMNVDAASRDFKYRLRHRVKPGMSGWAQVNGHRGPTKTDEQMEQRLKYDLWYIDNWSLWLDLRILLRSLRIGFRDLNAY